MASTSETTFGAKLRNAQDLVTYITGFVGYVPPRTQETVASMTTLISSLIATNATEASQQENYKVAVDNRQAAFSKKTGSVDKLLSPIKGAVERNHKKNESDKTY